MIAALTVFFALQLDGLRWETDARVYLPKGHEGIIYDEKVDDIFGVKDTLIVTVVNDEEGIYNTETLKRIDRITKAISKLPGVLAKSDIDVASITSATVFEGDSTRMGAMPVMNGVPESDAEIALLKQRINLHKDLLVGNIVSADGNAAMIRAKIKEGARFRYQSYFQVKAILAKETGAEMDWGPWGGGGNWDKKKSDDKKADAGDGAEEEEWEGNQWNDGTKWKNGKRIDEVGNNDSTNQIKEEASGSDSATSDEEEWEGNQWVDGSKWKGGKRIDEIQAAPAATVKHEPQQEPDKSGDAAVKDEEWEGNKWVAGKNWQDGMPVEAETKKADQSVDWVASEFVAADAKDGKTVGHKNEAVENKSADNAAAPDKPIKDKFYISGRPVIEVSSGMFAMADMELMVPLLILVMAIVLLVIFRTWRGMILPIMVMSIAIIWTFGLMVVTDVPLYTISTMLPVILVAVGIGDGVHLISSYYDKVLENPKEDAKVIVRESTLQLGAPLVMTSVTTAIGFLALMFAEMPPFKVFGVFALIGILFSWIISATLLPAVLSMLKPKVGNYLEKRRAMRVYAEKNRLAYLLTASARWINSNKQPSAIILSLIVLVTLFGSSKLSVDSSWMSDFREDTEISQATRLINDRFSGTIFLNVVIEA
ncbi:MAG: MMPL family transporter, partial [Gammaproteobacteria bacterium]|nr:MMPL family transporter [Gammaproteobacteria bacterium]